MINLNQAKQVVQVGLAELAQCEPAALGRTASALLSPHFVAHASHPINDLGSPDEAIDRFWKPLKASFRHLRRTHTMVAAGEFNGSTMVGVLGHYRGTFCSDWLGIPATHKPAWLRFGEIHRVEDGRIAESWMLPDILDLIRQAGIWPLAPSLGAEAAWPAPDRNTPAFGEADPVGGRASLDLVLAMHAGLLSFDGKTLASMDHARFWTPDFAWYGPAGIGTAFGLDGFQTVHQIPFLIAFPDRKGGQHIGRIGDGQFVVTGGWPSVTATHTGDGFLGMPATGRRVGMRVMDFYRCGEGLIAENWVPLDIIHLLLQMGYDVFERLAHLRGNPRTSL
jgi:predicted ester cyclase